MREEKPRTSVGFAANRFPPAEVPRGHVINAVHLEASPDLVGIQQCC